MPADPPTSDNADGGACIARWHAADFIESNA
jgi:hypothetical protein